MTRTSVLALALLLGGLSSLSACHSDPNRRVRGAAADQHVVAPDPDGIAREHLQRDNQANPYQGTEQVDPEQREYARASRERLRAIAARAEELQKQREDIPVAAQGDAAATLNLLPRKYEQTEREIDALETLTSEKWQQRRHEVDRSLVNLERSLDRAQAR